MISWVPAALLLVVWTYVSGYDAWGQWAAAPLLLFPVLISALFLVAGLLVRRSEAEARSRSRLTFCLAIAGIPVLWLLFRLVLSL